MAFDSVQPQVGAWQTAYLLSLADHNPAVWRDPDQASMGLRRRKGHQQDTIRPVYQWDLHGLTSYFSRSTDGSGYYTTSHQNPYWFAVLADSVDVDTGSSVYNPLPSTFTVPAFTHPVADGHVSSVGMSLSPMMPKYDEYNLVSELSPSYLGEQKLYEATVTPGAPFLVATTLASQDFYGPVFASSIDYEVSGMDGLSPVQIQVSWEGGKSVRSPVMAQFIAFGGDLSSYGYTNEMRSANMMDCGFDCAARYSVADLNLSMATTRYWNLERLSSLRLRVSQRIEFTNTCHSPGRSDKHGPRFASIYSREVSGSVTFAGRNEFPDFPACRTAGPVRSPCTSAGRSSSRWRTSSGTGRATQSPPAPYRPRSSVLSRARHRKRCRSPISQRRQTIPALSSLSWTRLC